MGKKRCQAIAKSTQQQCEKTPLSGTAFCWLHYPKKETVEFFILGILLTFLFQMLFNLLTISPEERKINQLQQEVGGLSNQNSELINGKNTLIAQNKKLSSKLDKYQKDLNEKEEKIKELEVKAKKTEKGISTTYDFNGAKRVTTRPGHISVSAGPEVKVFEEIKQLETQKYFSQLITLCEKQIEKTPDWLTPYMYLGVAHANTGNKNKAIELFEYVKDNSFGNKAYSQVEIFLEKIKNP